MAIDPDCGACRARQRSGLPAMHGAYPRRVRRACRFRPVRCRLLPSGASIRLGRAIVDGLEKP